MLLKILLTCLAIKDIVAQSDEFTTLLNTIVENIAASNAYQIPTNNERLVFTNNSNINDFGSYDFVIIGAGSAGSVLANKLTTNGKWKVLLLEAGGEKTNFSDIPAMSAYLQKSEMNWGYYTTPQTTCCQGMNNKQCAYPRGKVLGGSGTINAIIHTRGNKLDYDFWEALGNSGWSYSKVLPYFKQLENWQVPGDSGYHGFDGPVDANYTSPGSISLQPFLQATTALGIPTLDYDGKNQFGVSRIVFDINYNKRVSGYTAFLENIRNVRSNLIISKNSFVTKLLINKRTKEEYGAEFIKDGNIYQVKAKKEVILSAGTINSPQILMLSGIGPKEQLQKHKIEVVKNLPVGKNLQEHPWFIGLYARTNLTMPTYDLIESVNNYLNAAKPFTSLPGEAIGFKKLTRSIRNVPDIEYMAAVTNDFSDLATIMYNSDEITNDFLKEINQTTDIFLPVILLHEKSRGDVTLKSNNPADFPNINISFYSDKKNEDIEMVHKGIKFIQELLATEAYRSVNATLLLPTNFCTEFEQESKEFWYCVIRRMTIVTYHPVGTTRMGTSAVNSVVDNKLLVHGVRGLRVVDAGIMPEITSGHTNVVVYMIAAKISDEIIRKYS